MFCETSSSRANFNLIKTAAKQIASDKSVVIPEIRPAAALIGASVNPATLPLVVVGAAAAPTLAKVANVNDDPNALPAFDAKANEGIPADHDLTIYEACLIYGPTFPQIIKPFNFTPKNYDWFFTLFTPLCDFRIDYKDQILVGLDWGDSEIMINSGPSLKEFRATEDFFSTELKGLPRANKSLSDKQIFLLDEAIADGVNKKMRVALFTHFTLINYDNPKPINEPSQKFPASDAVFNSYTKGTFSIGRDWLYRKLNDGIHFTMSGHSHRSGVYALENADPNKMFAQGYHPAVYQQIDQATKDKHNKLFRAPTTTRIVVSSCGGPIGTQNIRGELFGWNLMRPSGTLLDMCADGPQQLQRIVAKKYPAAKPRFCVALDYVQAHMEKQIFSWLCDGNGSYRLVHENVVEAKNFVGKLTFYVWNARLHRFEEFDCKIDLHRTG